MTVLGIDPGYDRCGWAKVKSDRGRLIPLEFDCLQTDKRLSKMDRFRLINKHFKQLFDLGEIDALAVETLYFSRNVSTALPVSEVRGMLFGLALSCDVPIYEYSPASVKLAVTGHGRADKVAVQKMTARLLNLEKIPKIDDTVDALAVAVTHLVQSSATRRL